MTTFAPETLISQEADLIVQLQKVLRDHPGGECFQLLFTPAGVVVADDEILVQVVTDQHTVELRPRKLTDLDPEDVIHQTQVLRLADNAFNEYAHQVRAPQYFKTTSRGHLMSGGNH